MGYHHRDMESGARLVSTLLASVAGKSLIAFSAIALFLSLGGCKTNDEINKLVIADINISTIRDGTYQGERNVSLVTAKVLATVRAGRLESVKVLKHRHGPGKGAEAIIDRVIASQSLKVDSVSGATGSSKIMLKAIESALEKGL